MKKKLAKFLLLVIPILYIPNIPINENEVKYTNYSFLFKKIGTEHYSLSSSYLLDGKVSENTALKANIKKYTNTTVNVRKSMNTESKILATLNQNAKVIKYADYKGWSYISTGDDVYGFVKSKYLCNNKTLIEKLNRWNINLTKDEIDLLAKILYLEAGNQPYRGQVAVVECIFNRMIDEYFGGSLHDVLSAPGQFVTWRRRNKAKPTKENYEVIKDVLRGKTNVISMDYVYFSVGGHKKHKDYIKIYDHQFCTE